MPTGGRGYVECNRTGEVPHACQESRRQEREAVRRPQEEGDVEAAGGEDRELARILEQRREEVRVRIALEELGVAGWDDTAEEGRRAQGRQGCRAISLTRSSDGAASVQLEQLGELEHLHCSPHHRSNVRHHHPALLLSELLCQPQHGV